jgi:hypothetical protein
VSVDKSESLRKPAMEPLVDRAMVLRKRGAGHQPGDEGTIARVPPAGRLIRLLNERVSQGRPFDGVVDQDFTPQIRPICG